MTHRDFIYWLQGHIEIGNPKKIGEIELQIIRDHLKLVITTEAKNKTSQQGQSIVSASILNGITIC